MKHLELQNVHSIQFLDKSSSKWVTHFRNSPGIAVNKGCIIHMKGKETIVEEDYVRKITVKQEDPSAEKIEDSPTKRKARASFDTIDLTLSGEEDIERSEKKKRMDIMTSASPNSKGVLRDMAVGSVPAKLSRFPPRTIAELDTRLDWMDTNRSVGTLEARFGMVFTCKFVSTSYYNHRNVWRHLRAAGELQKREGGEEWLPIYRSHNNSNSAVSTSKGIPDNGKD